MQITLGGESLTATEAIAQQIISECKSELKTIFNV
jgi:hypothetical protein